MHAGTQVSVDRGRRGSSPDSLGTLGTGRSARDNVLAKGDESLLRTRLNKYWSRGVSPFPLFAVSNVKWGKPFLQTTGQKDLTSARSCADQHVPQHVGR